MTSASGICGSASIACSLVLPASSAVFIANPAYHAAPDAAALAAVQATLAFRRNAAILELADRCLGELPEPVLTALGLQTTARRVLISAAQQRHAILRRAVASKPDADLVALRLTEALSNVRYHLLPRKNARTFALVGYSPSADRHLVLVVKLVSAVSARTRKTNGGSDGAPAWDQELPPSPGNWTARCAAARSLTRLCAEAWSQVRVEFRRAPALRNEVRRAGWFN